MEIDSMNSEISSSEDDYQDNSFISKYKKNIKDIYKIRNLTMIQSKSTNHHFCSFLDESQSLKSQILKVFNFFMNGKESKIQKALEFEDL